MIVFSMKSCITRRGSQLLDPYQIDHCTHVLIVVSISDTHLKVGEGMEWSWRWNGEFGVCGTRLGFD